MAGAFHPPFSLFLGAEREKTGRGRSKREKDAGRTGPLGLIGQITGVEFRVVPCNRMTLRPGAPDSLLGMTPVPHSDSAAKRRWWLLYGLPFLFAAAGAVEPWSLPPLAGRLGVFVNNERPR